MGIDAGSISLIVASLDLKLVQLLRGAMNTDAGRATPLGPAPNTFAGHLHPTDRYEPRRVLHPTPRYEPRPVLHPTPRLETGPVLAPATDLSSVNNLPATTPPTSHILPSPIEPVWKSLPPIENRRPGTDQPPVVKVFKPAPVISYKGMLLDFFV